MFKLSRLVSPQLQQSSYIVYKFFSTAVTYPLLFAIDAEREPGDQPQFPPGVLYGVEFADGGAVTVHEDDLDRVATA